MTANWTLILNWIIQGLILGGFALAGVYLALRLFAGQRTSASPPSQPAAEPSGFVAPAAVFSPRPGGEAQPSTGRRNRRPSQEPDLDAVRHAFEFGDDDRLTMILELPAAYLADDGALVELWVDAVGWARLEQNHQDAGKAKAAPSPPSKLASVGANSDHLQTHLDQVLQRLQLSADRRGQLRAMLDQKMPASEAER